ncbi:MAG: tetratricopeptide repeat protein [Candidatus Eisenbacteria bacterium]|nr:tetratricopeptide repeat protein [Candidatus Eisenbacteria bacterium]
MGGSSERRRILPLIALLAVGWGGAVYDENADGTRAYGEGSYEEALRHFLAAERERPEEGRLSFNVAAALFRLGRLEEALAAYRGAASDSTLTAESLYGAGNVLLQSGKPEEAAEMYKRSLRRDPTDEDVKHNLELALRMMEQQQEQQQQDQQQQDQQQQDQQQQDQQQQDQQQQDQQQQDQQQQDQQQQDQQQQDQQQQDQQQQDQQQQDQQQQDRRPNEGEQPPQDGEMTREQAHRILQALAEEEESRRRESMEKRVARPAPSGKDW